MPDPVVAEAVVPEVVAAPAPLAEIENLAEYRERRGKGEGAEPTEAAEEKPAAKVEEVATEPDAASKAGKELAAKRGSLQARIDELTREKHTSATETATAKAEAATLKAELAALKAGKPAAEAKTDAEATPASEWKKYRSLPGAPKETDFEDYGDFVFATQAFVSDAKFKEYEARNRSEGQASANEAAHARVLSEGTKAHDDFQEKVAAFEAAGGQYSPAAQQVILRHELGHEFAYAFVTDPSIAARINGAESPYAAMLEAGAVVAELKAAKKAAEVAAAAPKAKLVTKAPAPIESVVGESAASTPDPGSMSSVTEWRKQRAKFLNAA